MAEPSRVFFPRTRRVFTGPTEHFTACLHNLIVLFIEPYCVLPSFTQLNGLALVVVAFTAGVLLFNVILNLNST